MSASRKPFSRPVESQRAGFRTRRVEKLLGFFIVLVIVSSSINFGLLHETSRVLLREPDDQSVWNRTTTKHQALSEWRSIAAQPLSEWRSVVAQNPFVSNRSVIDVPLALYQTNKSPVGDLLKVYVYDLERDDTLKEYTTEVFEWFRTEKADSNWITDVVLINLFRSFPGRTENPDEADIFVVPYPHLGHCMKATGYSLHCKQLDSSKVEETIEKKLVYYNETTKERHLFFMSDFEMLAQKWIANQPLLVTYGPLWQHASSKRRRKRYRSPKGHFVVPQFNPSLRFQPSFVERDLMTKKLGLEEKHKLDAPAVRDSVRDLSLTFVASYENKRMRKTPKVFRKYLLRALYSRTSTSKLNATATPDHKTNFTTITIGGLPFYASSNVAEFSVGSSDGENAFSLTRVPTNRTNNNLYDLYRRSIFCPILPGDVAWQRRFFDAMACGCLPVVVSYPLSAPTFQTHKKHYHNSSNGTKAQPVSWFVPLGGPHEFGDTWSVQEVYPFVTDIDYPKFVVESPGNESHPETTATNLVETLEQLLLSNASSSTELKRNLHEKQLALRQYVGSVLYGVGPDAHRTNDAFALLIRALRRYIDDLGG